MLPYGYVKALLKFLNHSYVQDGVPFFEFELAGINFTVFPFQQSKVGRSVKEKTV